MNLWNPLVHSFEIPNPSRMSITCPFGDCHYREMWTVKVGTQTFVCSKCARTFSVDMGLTPILDIYRGMGEDRELSESFS